MRWVRTRAGKAMPVDVAPAANGNVALLGDNGCEVLAGADLEAAHAQGRQLHLSHFATCKDGAAWRRR